MNTKLQSADVRQLNYIRCKELIQQLNKLNFLFPTVLQTIEIVICTPHHFTELSLEMGADRYRDKSFLSQFLE